MYLSPKAYDEGESREERRVIDIEQNVPPLVRNETLNGVVDGSGASGQNDGTQETLLDGDPEGLSPTRTLLVLIKRIMNHHQNLSISLFSVKCTI